MAKKTSGTTPRTTAPRGTGKKTVSSKPAARKTASKPTPKKSTSRSSPGRAAAAKPLSGKPAAKKPAAASATSRKRGTTGKARAKGRSGASSAARGGESLRDETREITRMALDGRGISAASIRKVVDTLLGDAVETVRSAIPATRESTLREVVQGVAEGADAAMGAGRRGASGVAKHARAVGEAVQPLQDSVLKSGHEAFDAMMEFSKSLAGTMREQVASIVDETRRATREMRPAAERIGKAVSEDPAALAKDSVKAAARIAAGGATQFITSAGGVLSGIGAALEERLDKPSRSKKAKRS